MGLGNIYSKRDWGFSKDYVEAMWKMLQKKKPENYVISSGKTYTVKEFVNKAAKNFGFNLSWTGVGLKEKAIDLNTNKVIISIEKKYFRPTEVNSLFGDSTKAIKELKWLPRTNLDKLIRIMCEYEKSKYN